MANQVLSVVGILSNYISTFLTEKGQLLGGFRQEIQFINIEFSQMKAFLEMVDFSGSDDPLLKLWIRQLRQAAYKTEDVLDEFELLFYRHHGRGFLGSVCSNFFKSIKNCPARYRLATELQSIKAEIKAISDARLKYESEYAHVHRSLPANEVWRYNKDDEALFTEVTQLVGIDGPKNHLISLLEDPSPFKVIAVCGMGGIGKTTITKQVYDDAQVKSHFQVRAWVTVSQTYDIVKLLKDLIQKLHKNPIKPDPIDTETMDVNDLKEHIRDLLQQGRYIIVFDDIWDQQFWNTIKAVLPKNSHGGNRVMVTTRKASVASASCAESNSYLHRMEYLSFEDSWTLFCRRTFKDKSCPAHLEDVARGIVNKCDGLPLAILAISGVLASKELSRTDTWELIRRRLEDEYEGTGKLDRARKILRLSYDDLPSYLKSCLLYIAIYPEDRTIPSLHLIRLWVAERLVEQRAGLDVVDVGWSYIRELIDKSLILVAERAKYHGFPSLIQVHDLFQEIIVKEATEINFITLVESTTQPTGLGWPSETLVRRLVFRDNVALHECLVRESRRYFETVRSIITFGCYDPLSKEMSSRLLSSKFLNVVVLEGMELEAIPREIFKLFRLRHLDLSYTNVTVIPKSIKKLEHLEHLILRETEVKELPEEILKLQKLRHLEVFKSRPMGFLYGYYGFKPPRNMGVFSKLQVLKLLDVSENDKTRIVSEIGQLTQLRELGIANLRNGDGKELCSSLEKLTKLQFLSVGSSLTEENDNDEATLLDLNHPMSALSLQTVSILQLNGCLENMPPWIAHLQSLRRIELVRSGIKDDVQLLESLQYLPNLVILTLWGAYLGETLCFKTGCFLKLMHMKIANMKGLKWITMDEGAMPNINRLGLIELPHLQELPSGIQHLMQLQKLELWGMGFELSKDSEEYKRVAHVPHVEVYFERDGKWRVQD